MLWSDAKAVDSDTLQSENSDAWFAFDKVQHFTFSFLWTLSSQYILENKCNQKGPGTIGLATGSALSAGLAKECYDRSKPNGYFSKRDMVADIVGILCAVIVIRV